MPHLYNNSETDRVQHYKLPHRTSCKTVLSQHDLPPWDCEQIKICMVLSEVISWLRVHVTSTHWADVITTLKISVEWRLSAPLISNISSDIRRRVCCHFLFNSELFRNLITIWWVVYFEKTESPGGLTNFQLHFSNDMFLMSISKMKIKLYCMLKKKTLFTRLLQTAY